VKGHGVGADNDLGAEIAEEDIDEVQGAIDEMPIHDIDAFVLVAALGGGTGSGGAPVIAKHLRRIYTEPVYGLGIPPAGDEGGIYSLNAARSLQAFTRETDNLPTFDNDAWRKAGETMEEGYARLNDELVRRFGVLLSAGEVGHADEVGQNVVDSSEIVNALDAGGVSTVGYAAADLERNRGLLSRFRTDDGDTKDVSARTTRITSLVRQATAGRLTLPCEVASAERALVVVSGPPEELDRKGIEHARTWLEEQTGSLEVRGGDYPIPGERRVAVSVLLSGVTDVPRVKALQRIAVETKDAMSEKRARNREELRGLIEDDGDELQPLF
jgi:cell division GTPase FtsZ